ncbi:MAG TPA: tRNA pseudouridine(54/55) synthase Pus10 [bacterium]|nr:tRNA pseudouridine(54/55) synthase Pus10 [bacterium]
MSRIVDFTEQELLEFAQNLNLCSECIRSLTEISGINEATYLRRSDALCTVCSDVRGRYAQVFEQVSKELNAVVDDWHSFRIDVLIRSPPNLDEKGSALFQALKEGFKREFKREVGSRIERSGKVFDPLNPDLLINFERGQLIIKRPTLYLEGRYLKLFRNISQAKWVCNNCYGNGCTECNYKGRHFIASVEEFITTPILLLYQAERVVFHAGGREDVDVLVVGKGRPFVVEVVNPARRTYDLKTIEKAVNEYSNGIVQITLIGFTNSSRIEELKSLAEVSTKVYRGVIKFFERVDLNKLMETSKELSGITLEQQTPWRVKKRRADKVRNKKVYSFNVEYVDDYTARFTVVCQGGTYVKEFISGDDGRTKPSVSQILGIRCKCIALDLVGVDMGNDEKQGL